VHDVRVFGAFRPLEQPMTVADTRGARRNPTRRCVADLEWMKLARDRADLGMSGKNSPWLFRIAAPGCEEHDAVLAHGGRRRSYRGGIDFRRDQLAFLVAVRLEPAGFELSTLSAAPKCDEVAGSLERLHARHRHLALTAGPNRVRRARAILLDDALVGRAER